MELECVFGMLGSSASLLTATYTLQFSCSMLPAGVPTAAPTSVSIRNPQSQFKTKSQSQPPTWSAAGVRSWPEPSLTGPVGSAGNCTIIIDFELCLTRNVDVLPASVQRSAFGVLHPTDAGKPAMRFHVFNPTPLWPTGFDSWPGLARDCIENLFATEVKYLIIANTRSAKNQPTKRV